MLQRVIADDCNRLSNLQGNLKTLLVEHENPGSAGVDKLIIVCKVAVSSKDECPANDRCPGFELVTVDQPILRNGVFCVKLALSYTISPDVLRTG